MPVLDAMLSAEHHRQVRMLHERTPLHLVHPPRGLVSECHSSTSIWYIDEYDALDDSYEDCRGDTFPLGDWQGKWVYGTQMHADSANPDGVCRSRSGRTGRFRMTPAPYEKAQASEEICQRAAHPGSKLNQKKCRGGRACACVCLHVCILEPHATLTRMTCVRK